MFVLGIEAATQVAAVAVVCGERLVAERLVNNQRTHSVNLLPMIKGVMEDAQVDRRSLAGIAVSTGPGSFTGLRIGMATAKTLAQAWGLPVVGVGTLEALAYALWGREGLICPVLHAKKDEVYAALYRMEKEELCCVEGPLALSPPELVQKLLRVEVPVTLVGDGALMHRELFRGCLGNRVAFAPDSLMWPRGAHVAELGYYRLMQDKGCDPLELLPNYVRPSEAEVKWLQKQQSKSGVNSYGSNLCGNDLRAPG